MSESESNRNARLNARSGADSSGKNSTQYSKSTLAQNMTVEELSHPELQSPNSVLQKNAERRSLPENAVLKMLDFLYWKRLGRYLYIRFVRMQSSPQAIARGLSVGVFSGSFPLLGFQSLIAIALATLFQGNKVVAVASTWISNPLTYFPLFAFNYYIGCWLLRMPGVTNLPTASLNITEWMAMGRDVATALMLGSFVVGIINSVWGYYLGLVVAQRVQASRAAKRK